MEQEVSFAINISKSKNVSALKSALDYNLSDAKKIILTIQNSDGTATTYTSAEVKIYQMNGAFISQKIILKTGSYQITEFSLVDSADNIIFATPLIGSLEAQNVTHPLPVTFEVAKDASTPISIEVLSTENKLPEDFGLVHFSIAEINVLHFMIGITDKADGKLLSARLTLTSGTYSYVQLLDSIANNVVTIKDTVGSNPYILVVEKDGYITYSQVFSRDSLESFSCIGNHLPMLIELNKNENIGTVTDIDGNVYKTIKIGNQWWMAENLKVTHYRNGDSIPYVIDNIEWNNKTTGACCDYNNDPNISNTYGKLYNYYAAKDIRNIAPLGWHVAIKDDWRIDSYLGGIAGNVGAKLKETGITHWQSPNTGATNITGFTALPGGYRSGSSFHGLGTYGLWVTCFNDQPGMTGTFFLRYNSSDSYFQHAEFNYGLSVRCVRD
jgi:uncharacterized protein (TIGR02145 family)